MRSKCLRAEEKPRQVSSSLGNNQAIHRKLTHCSVGKDDNSATTLFDCDRLKQFLTHPIVLSPSAAVTTRLKSDHYRADAYAIATQLNQDISWPISMSRNALEALREPQLTFRLFGEGEQVAGVRFCANTIISFCNHD